MTLDEAIKDMQTIAEEYQRVVDTGIVSDGITIDMLYCDDTEVIDKHLANYQKAAENYRQLAEWLRDYKLLKKQEPKWIPVKWHEITDEERKENDYPKEWACYLDSIMPYDGQRILITTKGGYVELDECCSDDGQTFSLDSGYDWVDDVVAWMPLPKPYEQEVEE